MGAIKTTKSLPHSTRIKPKEITLPIDLPGQPIQCWIGDADKVTVLLRKHRDFVVDVNMGSGKTYVVWTAHGDMYDTRTKKLVHPREKVEFKDGELLHLWISRDFKGEISLFGGDKKLGAYSVTNLDNSAISLDPQFKPAPITIVIKKDDIFPVKPLFNVMQTDENYTSPSAEQLQETEKFLQIVELKLDGKNIPKEITDFFVKGGQKEIIASGGVATSNWIMSQVFAQCGYLVDNKNWIRELWDETLTLRAVEHASGRKIYAILTGSTRVRRMITAARYGVTNTKVLALTFGAGSIGGLRHAGWAAESGNFKGAGIYSMLFTISLDIAEWSADYEQRDPVTGKPKQDLGDLFAKIGVDITKSILNSIISSCLMWGVLGAIGGAPVVVVIVGTILISLAVGWTIDYLDKNNAISEGLIKAIKASPSKLEEKMRNDYDGYLKSLIYALKKKGMLYDFDATPIR